MLSSLAIDSRTADVGRSLAAKWRSRTSICSGVDRLRRLRGAPAGGGASGPADAPSVRRRDDEPTAFDSGVPGLAAAGFAADSSSGWGMLANVAAVAWACEAGPRDASTRLAAAASGVLATPDGVAGRSTLGRLPSSCLTDEVDEAECPSCEKAAASPRGGAVDVLFGLALGTRRSARATTDRGARATCLGADDDDDDGRPNESKPCGGSLGRSCIPGLVDDVRDGGGATPVGGGASSDGVRGSEPEDDVGVPESDSGGDQADMRGVWHDIGDERRTRGIRREREKAVG
jgi:hypothetical protein